MNTDWSSKIEALNVTAKTLAGLDVLDISFTDGTEYEVYVAATQQQRINGLSNIASLDLDGMLFCYETPSYAPFTMKGMLIDIEIAWYTREGELIAKRALSAGQDEEPIYSPRPYMYVLESPGIIPASNLRVRA